MVEKEIVLRHVVFPLYRHPEKLEPDPLLRKEMCPVAIRKKEYKKSVTDVRDEIIKAKNKAEVIAILIRHCEGINSDTAPDDEWWKKLEKLGVRQIL